MTSGHPFRAASRRHRQSNYRNKATPGTNEAGQWPETPPILQFWKGIECSQIILDDEHRDSGHFHVMTSQHWAGHIGAGNFTWIGL